MCCTRLAEIQEQKSPFRHHRTICRAVSSQLRHVSTIGKKILLNIDTSSTCPRNMANFTSLTAEVCLLVCGAPPNCNRFFSRLAFVAAATSLTGGQPNFVRCLAVSWAGTLYIHFLGLLPPEGILPGAKFTLRPSLAFSYIGSVNVQYGTRAVGVRKTAAWYLQATGRLSRSTLGGRTV